MLGCIFSTVIPKLINLLSRNLKEGGPIHRNSIAKLQKNFLERNAEKFI